MSNLEELLAWQIRLARLPEPSREYRFDPSRRYRADFAWPAQRLLLEVEGGLYTRGRHVRPKGYAADAAKYNHAQLLGFRVMRFTAADIKAGRALAILCKIFLDEKAACQSR